MAGADPAILRQIIIGAGLKFKQTSLSYVFSCPRCSGKDKLYIRKTNGQFKCFKCGDVDNYKGRPEYALADLLNVPVKQAQSLLYGGSNIPVEVYLDFRLTDFFGDDDEELDEETVLLPTMPWPLDYYEISDEASDRGAAYLAGRGIERDLAQAYGIRYAPEKKRVVFPVQSGTSLYGWQERLIVSTSWTDPAGNVREMPKILSSPGIPRDKTLMFVDRIRGQQHAVLCEGPVDALKAHLCGGNVSTMGKAVSRQQVNLLLMAGIQKLYLALDPDAANETQRLVRDHFDDVELFEMIAPSRGKEKVDLGAMDFKEVHELFLGADRIRAGRLFFFLNPNLT